MTSKLKTMAVRPWMKFFQRSWTRRRREKAEDIMGVSPWIFIKVFFIISGIHPRSSAARMNASPERAKRAEEITPTWSSDFRTRIPSGIPRSRLCVSVIFLAVLIAGEMWVLFKSHDALSGRKEGIAPLAVHTVDDFKWNNEKGKWSAYMDVVGPEISYRYLKQSYERETFMVQHTAIHLLGVLFYEKFGLKGIGYCDNSFAFGCFHSFFAAASSKEGNTMLFDLDKECDRLSDRVDVFTCQHGIGHSLLAHGQMSDEELLLALTACDTLSHKEPISGCKSGAFMEYNFRSMASIERAGIMTLRSFDVHDPYAPCSQLPDIFLEACYFAQTRWWDKVLDHDYVRMGHLCSAITNEKYLVSCFMGVGNIASEYAVYDIPSVREICKKMPTEKGMEECLVNASWTFWSESRLRDKTPEVCKEADKAIKLRCAGGTDT